MSKTYIFFLVFLLANIFSSAQQNLEDTIHLGYCGHSVDLMNYYQKGYDDYRHSLADSTFQPDYPPVPFLPQDSFPDSLIIHCGSFRLHYEDFLHAPPDGFADPNNQSGIKRRNTLCQVLQYVQSIIHIHPGDSIDLNIQRSYTSSYPPPLNLANALAAASPYFLPYTWNTVQGIYLGNLFDHIISGTDPDTSNYDALLFVNFTKSFIDDTGSPANEKYDLYSILLHEITHAMGIMSGIKEDTNSSHYPVSQNYSFSLYDSVFLFYGTPSQMGNLTPLLSYDSLNKPFINSSLDTISNCLRANKIWLYNDYPDNQAVYSGVFPHPLNDAELVPYSLIGHLSLSRRSFYGMSQFQPCYQPLYVMGPTFTDHFDFKRNWTFPELRMLRNLGYDFDSAF